MANGNTPRVEENAAQQTRENEWDVAQSNYRFKGGTEQAASEESECIDVNGPQWSIKVPPTAIEHHGKDLKLILLLWAFLRSLSRMSNTVCNASRVHWHTRGIPQELFVAFDAVFSELGQGIGRQYDKNVR